MSETNENESMSKGTSLAFFCFGIVFSILGLAIFILGIVALLPEIIVGALLFLAMGIPFIVIWAKDKFKIKKKTQGESKHILKKISIAVIVVIMLVGVISCALSPSGIGGDGKSSCKNCGRNSVYALGFCKSCYKSFHDFTYDNDE